MKSILLVAVLFSCSTANRPTSSTSCFHSVAHFDDEPSVVLEIQFGDLEREKKVIEGIPFTNEMTVLDVMKHAKETGKLKFAFRGRKDTAFLTEIDGVKNQGAKGDNWIFRVNGELGKKSFGISEVKEGDRIIWSFGKYQP